MAGQISGDVGTRTGVGLAADQMRCSEGASPVAGQTSCVVGPLPEHQRGETKAEAPARRKVRREASPPGLPLEAMERRGEPARAPSGSGGEERRGEPAPAPPRQRQSPTGLGGFTTGAGLGAGGRDIGDCVARGWLESAPLSIGRKITPLSKIIFKKSNPHGKVVAGGRQGVCPLGPQFWSDPSVTVSMGSEGAGPKCRHGWKPGE